MRKLTDIEIIECYNRYKTGELFKDLILEYNVSFPTLKKYFKKLNLITRRSKTSFDYNFFENINTENKAYWLGYIYADGYISGPDHGKHEYKLSLSVSGRDVDHLNKFKTDIKSDHKLIYIPENKVKYKNKDSLYIRKPTYRLDIYDKKLYYDLLNKGLCQRKSLVLKFPINIVPEIFIKDFIRGYFDGDGSIYYDKSCNQNKITILGTIDFLTEYLNNLPFKCNILKDRRTIDTYYIKITGKKVKLFYSYVYRKAGVYMNRKKEKFLIYDKGKASETRSSILSN